MAERERPITWAEWKAQHRWTRRSAPPSLRRFSRMSTAMMAERGMIRCGVNHRRHFVSALGYQRFLQNSGDLRVAFFMPGSICSDKHIRALVKALDCRLVDVRPDLAGI